MMFNRILLAYDGSDGSKLAFEKAAEIAKLTSAEFHILAVGRIPEYAETVSEVDEAKEQARNFYLKIMDEAIRNLSQRDLAAVSHMEFGKPGDVILRIAEDLKADLVVLGTNFHSALRRRFLGATVDKVVDHSHCSVLVIKGGS
jgi:nucleotide-binding universal stress UspA family protein